MKFFVLVQPNQYNILIFICKKYGDTVGDDQATDTNLARTSRIKRAELNEQ